MERVLLSGEASEAEIGEEELIHPSAWKRCSPKYKLTLWRPLPIPSPQTAPSNYPELISQRPAGLPVLTSQSPLRLSITTFRCVSSFQRSRKSCSSSGLSSPILSRQPSTQHSMYLSSSASPR